MGHIDNLDDPIESTQYSDGLFLVNLCQGFLDLYLARNNYNSNKEVINAHNYMYNYTQLKVKLVGDMYSLCTYNKIDNSDDWRWKPPTYILGDTHPECIPCSNLKDMLYANLELIAKYSNIMNTLTKGG